MGGDTPADRVLPRRCPCAASQEAAEWSEVEVADTVAGPAGPYRRATRPTPPVVPAPRRPLRTSERALRTTLEGSPMASTCQLCDKKPWYGKQVSHSHRRSSKRWDPNIQRVKAYVDGRTVKLDVCTSCIKAGKVTRPPVKA